MKFPRDLIAAHYDSPLGRILLAATPRGLAGLWFEGQRYHPGHDWALQPDHPVLSLAMRQLDEYFAGRRTTFDLPLDLQGGTAFQQSVWRALLSIPCGERTTYGALSRGLGQPQAVRAVGAAVGRNPVSIVVPCHRVLGTDGSLTGYAGGLERKTALLRLEGMQ
ncbi:methylated-DNA--[protein]-cysteine S-methyltransferase [Ramlibacter humi]|uniref:Methylated-DNA--protein-cysteine methyltransferase n=1 Tax=Ramlibacter humi TaxID=2530451 RepID=A0A4Z0BN23_9BURK|nr:methylated-DNA--[protein]-cysteine S-methyltransferase [Ramlibacter humi]TFZ00172.1 methylated-DNA--[protein]-cysteine S-methyltransferase [Ramlibacter humi]